MLLQSDLMQSDHSKEDGVLAKKSVNLVHHEGQLSARTHIRVMKSHRSLMVADVSAESGNHPQGEEVDPVSLSVCASIRPCDNMVLS